MSGKVVILRGPSGSGKSVYASNHFRPSKLVSADNFFVVDGEYKFDPSRIGMAHADCMHQFLMLLNEGAELIVVDNTNIHIWEFINYVEAANLAGYEIEIVEFAVKTVEAIKVCIGRNTHGVPPEVISRMAIEYEEWTSEANYYGIAVRTIDVNKFQHL